MPASGMPLIKAVTGAGITTSIALELTDLGIMRWDSDRNCVAVMFGDSFSFSWGQDWRSPVLACYDTDFNLLGVPVRDGVSVQPARQLWEYGHNNPDYSTVLPCDFIRVGRVWHVAVMLTQGLGNEKMTEFWHSPNLVDWTLTGKGFAHPASDPCTTMLSFDQFGDAVYVVGTHGLRRDGPIKMWKTPAELFPHGDWLPCNGGKPIRLGRHGELCLRNVQGSAVLSFFDEGNYRQTALTVAHPEDNWGDANSTDYAWGHQTPQLYGGYIAPMSKLNEPDGMKFLVSQWGTAHNNPYHVLAFSGTLQAKGEVKPPAASYDLRVASENGWQPGWVGEDELVWVDVPGVPVRLQLRKGQPATIMRAFAADYHAHVEHLRDPDSAGYRPADSVATSNHLNGTAMDLNHTTHPFRVKGTFSAAQLVTIRELLDWYEGTVFWGGDWDDPIDEMHWQMGGGTFNNPRTEDFIARKIRRDGYSLFRRPAVADAAVVLSDAMLGSLPLSRYAALAPAVAQCLSECGCNTVNRIAMWCAQVGQESGGLRYMEEIADGSAYEGRADLGNTRPGDGRRFKGRGPIQVTGRRGFTECSKWAFQRGLVPTPTFFVDDPAQLGSDRYGFVGVTWYWTTQRPMNEAADAGDLERATRYVNGGLTNLDDRRRRYEHCKNMGAQLLTLVQEVGGLVGEKVLRFDTSIIPQETGYWCGPASAQIALAVRGINVAEQVLARECGTTTGGTDHVRLIERCLDARLPGVDYISVEMPTDPPTQAQRDLLWQHIRQSIDAGFAVVMNWVAPPGNYPVGVKGSANFAYTSGTYYHYVACVGYDDRGARSVLIADPGFRPFLGWISFHQCATLLPPKGYAYAAASSVPVPPPPPAVVVPPAPARPLAGRPSSYAEPPRSVEDSLLDLRAEMLLTQALVFALCEKMGVDATEVYRRAKESFNG